MSRIETISNETRRIETVAGSVNEMNIVGKSYKGSDSKIHHYKGIISTQSPNIFKICNRRYETKTNGITFRNREDVFEVFGTAEDQAVMPLIENEDEFKLLNLNKYVLSGGVSSKRYIRLSFYKQNEITAFRTYYCYDKPLVIDDMQGVEYGRVTADIVIEKGEVVANDHFKPMIVELLPDGSYITEFQRYQNYSVDTVKIEGEDILSGLGDRPNFYHIENGSTTNTYSITQIWWDILGNCDFTYDATNKVFVTEISFPNNQTVESAEKYVLCEQYIYRNTRNLSSLKDGEFVLYQDYTRKFCFKNSAYTNSQSFKTAMANVRFEHLAEPLQGQVKKPTYFWVLKTFSPYTYVSVDGEVELNYNAYEWQNPKINWLPTDYFNVIDFERIVNNIDYVYNLALSLYPPFNHRYVDKDVEYTYIPHADTWNNISYNLRTINANTLNLSFGNYPTYVDNGKSPNYEMFNLWETHTQNLLEGLRDKAKLLPRLKCKLGAKQLGIRY